MTPSLPPPVPPTVHQSRNDLPVAAMICGILSLTGFGIFLGIPALIMGSIALKRNYENRSFSITGLVTGAISTFLSLLVLAFMLLLFTQEDNSPSNYPPYDSRPGYNNPSSQT